VRQLLSWKQPLSQESGVGLPQAAARDSSVRTRPSAGVPKNEQRHAKGRCLVPRRRMGTPQSVQPLEPGRMRPRHITPRDYPEWRSADGGHRQAGAQRALRRLPGHGEFLDAVDEHIAALVDALDLPKPPLFVLRAPTPTDCMSVNVSAYGSRHAKLPARSLARDAGRVPEAPDPPAVPSGSVLICCFWGQS